MPHHAGLHPEGILQAVTHINRDLLPGLEAEVAQLQKGLVFRILNLFDHRHDITLQIHQDIDVIIDLVLQVNHLADDGFHGAGVSIGCQDRFRYIVIGQVFWRDFGIQFSIELQS